MLAAGEKFWGHFTCKYVGIGAPQAKKFEGHFYDQNDPRLAYL